MLPIIQMLQSPYTGSKCFLNSLEDLDVCDFLTVTKWTAVKTYTDRLKLKSLNREKVFWVTNMVQYNWQIRKIFKRWIIQSKITCSTVNMNKSLQLKFKHLAKSVIHPNTYAGTSQVWRLYSAGTAPVLCRYGANYGFRCLWTRRHRRIRFISKFKHYSTVTLL